MERSTYMKRSWRDLPRDYCIVDLLLGEAAGPCSGLIHHHHVDPTDEGSRTVQCCARHHSALHTALRAILRPSGREWRRCTHRHRSAESRASCERRLNRLDSAA